MTEIISFLVGFLAGLTFSIIVYVLLKENSMAKIFIDYTRAIECEEETFGYMCYKCGKCGRKFNDYGIMVDDGGTTPDEGEEYDLE